MLGLWPGRYDEGDLGDEVSLGEGGLELDSIDIVELLLACEAVIGGPSTDALLELGPIEIGVIVDHFAAG